MDKSVLYLFQTALVVIQRLRSGVKLAWVRRRIRTKILESDARNNRRLFQLRFRRPEREHMKEIDVVIFRRLP